jgi:multicomponent Na+:H+ antiporter subunit D
VSNALLIPILVPFVTAIACVLAKDHLRTQRAIALLGAATTSAAALALLLRVDAHGLMSLRLGDWAPPFGIVFVADRFGLLMVLMASLVGLAALAFSIGTVTEARERVGYYPFAHILLMGANGAFLTGDAFNLYVWFEVLLISSFVLLALGDERRQMEGATKYVVLNLVSTVCLLTALGLLYGLAGTLNMAQLSLIVPELENKSLVTAVALLFMIAFGIKAAVFPFFFWLPASYHTPPPAVSALFAGILTKVGVYAMVRMFTLVFVHDVETTHTLLLFVAGATMLTGVLGAVAHADVRRILSFHIVSQIGFMIMGLALYTKLALAGAVFYIGHHILVKTNLFLAAGIMRHVGGTLELKALGGMATRKPLLAVLFALSALALAGIPPLSGFWAKLLLVWAALEAESYLIVVAALLTGLLTLASMMKIWTRAFWGEPAGPNADPPRRMYLPVIGFAALSLAVAMAAPWTIEFALRAAEDLLSPAAYVQAVLGGAP